jgi:hypothetical protein
MRISLEQFLQRPHEGPGDHELQTYQDQQGAPNQIQPQPSNLPAAQTEAERQRSESDARTSNHQTQPAKDMLKGRIEQRR